MSRSEYMRASPRMFKNDLLDKVSRVHPAVPPLLFGPVIIAGLVLGFVNGAGLAALWAIPGGYLFWTLTEYWIHRIIFHWEPDHGLGARFHYLAHGVHHDHPNDPMRLVMPPSVSVPLASIFIVGFYLVLGSPDFFIFGASFLAGYLVYDMTHYYVHHFKPRTALGRKLRELHMRHHFQDDTTSYGISAPYWDTVFGTAASQHGTEKPAKPTGSPAGAPR
ncbi:MAG: sterol desaturase family protein [Solirubrobacteraceae bacterium]